MDWATLALGGLAVRFGLKRIGEALSSDVNESVDPTTDSKGWKPCPGNGKGGLQCHIARGGSIERRAAMLVEKIKRDSLDPRIRRMAVRAVSEQCGDSWCTPSRDGAGEIQKVFSDLKNSGSELGRGIREIDGVFHFTKRSMRYTGDHQTTDTFQGAYRSLADFHGGDCFPVGTIIRLEGGMSTVENIKIGDRIWGLNDWSTVIGTEEKGELWVSVLHLSDGGWVKLTESHHVFLTDGSRVRVAEVEVGDSLISPDGECLSPLRVIDIDRSAFAAKCYDLTTSDGYVFLPEAGVTVSNCDDHTVALGALLISLGYPYKLRIIRTTSASDFNHIYGMTSPSKSMNGPWIALDASVDMVKGRNGEKVPVYAGWEAPKSMIAEKRDFIVK